jgi:hypothetical protein
VHHALQDLAAVLTREADSIFEANRNDVQAIVLPLPEAKCRMTQIIPRPGFSCNLPLP